MPTCNPYFWFSIIATLLGLGLLVGKKIGLSLPIRIRRLTGTTWTGLVLIIVGVSVYAGAVAGYASCNGTPVTPCPGRPGTSGYRCTNEYEQCSWTGNCLTVKGFWWYESDCECKCESTGAAVSKIATEGR